MLRKGLNQLNARFIRSLTERKQDHDMKKQREQFTRMIEEFSEKETYTLKDYRRETEEHIKKTRKGLSSLWSGSEPEEAELILSKKILNAMKEEELLDDAKLQYLERKEIASVVQCDIQDVNKVLQQYRANLRLQEYVKARKQRQEFLPGTQDELKQMMLIDRPPKTKDSIFTKIPRYNKKELSKMHRRK